MKNSYLTSKTQLLKIATVFAGGNIVSMFLRISSGFLLTRSIDPEDLGIFSSINLFVGYSLLLQFGILDGFGRELPFQIGASNFIKAKNYTSNAKSWALLISILSSTIFCLIGIYYFSTWDLKRGFGWIAFAFNSFVNFYGLKYLQTTFRTTGDFSKLTIINIVVNLTGLICVFFVKNFSFFGLCIRLILIDLIKIILLSYYCPIKVKPIWDSRGLKELLKIGFPIFSVGLLYSYWTTINSTLVLKFLGEINLGYFQFVIMMATILEVVSLSLGQILYPRMSESYGKNNSVLVLWQTINKPMIILFFIQIPIICFAWYILPIIIPILFPKYEPAINALQWALVTYSLLTFKPISQIFNIIKRLDLLIVATLVGFAVNAFFLFSVFSPNKGLVVFPKALIFGRLAYILICYFFVKRLCFLEKRLKYIDN